MPDSGSVVQPWVCSNPVQQAGFVPASPLSGLISPSSVRAVVSLSTASPLFAAGLVSE
ncbi:hypothetical protein M419DRAFT_4997 [Trichoderma reesei RUT C-30]|uniref:Uncharacterized protein n=1 Tax=Hypocrea jecorina (strain ATCC 56765 / BCRC 32924 / NRRL 11460 / Rut C-30) TaxID=1344414 RepID=A0A024SL22_HYPJR|nr:hypothetical protein M419DRAFT_4997 [Trichoderma reesei RUT C-30]